MFSRLLLAIAAIAAASAPANAEWLEVTTRHFIILGDEDPAELRDYAVKLERFDQAVRSSRNMPDSPLTRSGKLTIYLFKDVRSLSNLAETGSGIYGLYVARASGAYAYVAKMKPHGPGEFTSDTVFFHEYAHHLMLLDLSTYYPPWLVEGFAEFLSTAQVARDGRVTIGAAADHRSAGVYAPDHDLPVSAIVSDTDRRMDGWQRELLYSRGWLLTHYLTFEPSRKGQLQRYVDGIRSGLSPGEAARAAFGDLLKLGRELDAYARRKTLSAMIVETDSSKIGPVSVRPLTGAESAILPVRMESDLGVSRAIAGRVADKAAGIARRFPGDASIQASLAEAEFDARHYDAAVAAADRALAIDASNLRALVAKGRALMGIADSNPASADWAAIRGLFARANHVDPENAEPLMLFYSTYRESGSPPTANAVKGLLYALVLAPQDGELRLLAVRQLLLDNRLAEAKRNFAPLASDPHARDFRDTGEEIVAAIDARDAAKAVQLIDNWIDKHRDD